ncbi:uncharacterized protein LOC135194675 [Vanessa tameamea]|uniref:Uncharacterized protein LOC135194675 n=1 Tax=Vanessa tameamea TaxID=334116 RepID=A0ABM4AZ25_VANTA
MFAFAIPINNGLIVKFNAVSTKEEKQSKTYGAVLTKTSQDFKPEANSEIHSQEIYPQATEFGTGSTNQIAKILFPSRAYRFNESKSQADTNFIKIPIIEQHVRDYKVIVANAPKNFRIGSGPDSLPIVIYIVFPNDEPEELSFGMPAIYFVKKFNGLPLHKNDNVDPLFIIDTNRTVTGLKSTEIFKYVKFKNQLTDRIYKAMHR